MLDDSDRWEQINPSPFAHEQDGLRLLRSYLPDLDPYHVWANVEFVGTDGTINEVDALVLTPSGLHLVELKHWQGLIEGDGNQWTRRLPNGRLTPEDNPYMLANRKARRLKSLIDIYAKRSGSRARVPYVGAAVFLHAVDVTIRLDPIGLQGVYGRDDVSTGPDSLKDFLLAVPAVPDRRVDEARGREIIALVKGAKFRPSVNDRRIGQLILHPRPFAEGAGWQDLLAGHSLDTATVRRVRFYLTSRAATEDIPVIRRAAEREFRLLQGIHHPGIARALDFVDHALGPAVVFDHTQGSTRFDQWLTERETRRAKPLALAQKVRLIEDLAEILDYAHSRRLAHRALHPRARGLRHRRRWAAGADGDGLAGRRPVVDHCPCDAARQQHAGSDPGRRVAPVCRARGGGGSGVSRSMSTTQGYPHEHDGPKVRQHRLRVRS